jgi:hypothetical protein
MSYKPTRRSQTCRITQIVILAVILTAVEASASSTLQIYFILIHTFGAAAALFKFRPGLILYCVVNSLLCAVFLSACIYLLIYSKSVSDVAQYDSGINKSLFHLFAYICGGMALIHAWSATISGLVSNALAN